MNFGSLFQEYCFVASNEHAAEVIGTNGFKIKGIALKTKTQIKCPSPNEAPIFCIVGSKRNVENAKRMINMWANNFDEMKNKKRNIVLHPGDVIETARFSRLDVACIIGKKGKQIQKIASFTQVKIISPDINKEPIFIISGGETNINRALFWMKLTAFCASGSIYFDENEIKIFEKLVKGLDSEMMKITQKFISEKIFRARIRNNLLLKNLGKTKNVYEDQCNYASYDPYSCCYCKQKKFRVAKALCGHILSCDHCIVDLYQNIYLRCYFCKFICKLYYNFEKTSISFLESSLKFYIKRTMAKVELIRKCQISLNCPTKLLMKCELS
ncbi:CLUMA_CG021551, isoform A [Clunio marinus]|uniref:CLUMA_CG021551, isoform A n=1 Tax=Clunio marinus TaxID=568069 RepID=A0A1J1J8P7_9DIPT|nr:CLUMA_CG021551, isoform A [Clunio marinus]